MPRQRKKFRVEEMSHGDIRRTFFPKATENAARHAEMMAELRTLRAMMIAKPWR